jgi:hypothetical protein
VRGDGGGGAAAGADPRPKRHRVRPAVPKDSWGCGCGTSNLAAEARCRRCSKRRGEGGGRRVEPELCRDFHFSGGRCSRRICKFLH